MTFLIRAALALTVVAGLIHSPSLARTLGSDARLAALRGEIAASNPKGRLGDMLARAVR